MLNLDDLTYKIRLDDTEVERSAARTAQQMQKLGAAVSPAQQGFKQLGANSKLTRQEMMALNYTLSDVAASLASGASPFTILLQQGGQVKDTFGGIGPLFSKLGSVLTIGRVAIGGVAAAVGALGYAFVKGYEESERFQKSVVLTGNAAGLTEGAFNALAGSVARSSGATIGSSREILQLLVETGQFGPQAIGEVAIAAAALAKVTGRTEQEVVKDFAGMSAGVAKWAADHSRSMNFITVEQYRYIRSLEVAGKSAEAQVYAAKLSEDATRRAAESLTPLAKAWNQVKEEASKAWDSMLAVGRADTLEQRIESARKLLEDAARSRGDAASIGPYGGPRASGEDRYNARQENLRLLLRAQSAQQANAAGASADAEKNRKEIEQQQRAAVEASLGVERSQFARSQAAGDLARERERISVERQYQQLEIGYTAYIAARERIDRAALSAKEATINEEISLEKRRVLEKPEDKLSQVARLNDLEAKRLAVMKERAQLEERIQQGTAGYALPRSQPETSQQQFVRFERQQQAEMEKGTQAQNIAAIERATQLREINRTLSTQLIRDDEERGLAQIALEERALRKQLDLETMSAGDRQAVEEDLAAWRALREQQLTEELKPEYQKRLELYGDFNRYMKQAAKEFNDGFIESGRDAFRTWVETGKLSANSITSFIRRKFADLVYDQYLAGIFDQFGKSIFSFLTGAGGGGLTVDPTGIGIVAGDSLLSATGSAILGRHAAGGNVRRGSLQEVNEFGTEMLTVKGRDYLMMGSNFGQVTSAAQTAERFGNGGKQQVIDSSVSIGSIGAGVNASEVKAYVRSALAQQEMRLRRLAANGQL